MIPVEALPGLAIALLTASTAIGLVVRRGQQERAAITRVSEAYGLRDAGQVWWAREISATGTWQGRTLAVRSYLKGSGKSAHRRNEVVLGGAPLGVTARAQGLFDNLLEAAGREHAATGDRAFDDATVLHLGDDTVVLDADARAALLEWTRDWSGTIDYGMLKADRRGRVRWPETRTLIDTAAAIAARLDRGVARTPEALARVAETDPVPAVRTHALLILARSAPETGRALAEHLLGDPVALVRATAAEVLAAAGVPVARTLLETAEPEVLVIALRVLALDPASEPLVIPLLGHAEVAVRLAAIATLARIGSVAAVEPLLPHTEPLLGGAVKAAAVDAVAAIQARLGGAEAGRVTLVAPGAGGELSVATGVAGSVAVVPVARPVAG